MTSSAVSQQIRRLETHFGVKLFERAGRGVRLTAAGEAALPVMRELWSRGGVGLRPARASSPGRPAATLRVAASDYLGKGLLAPVLRDLLDGRAAASLRDRHHALARRPCAWWPPATSTSRW